MAWSTSAIFREFVADMVGNTLAFDLDSDTIKAALYNNTPTPDKDSALTGYNEATSQWVVANEVSNSTNWAAGGQALDSKTVSTPASGVVMFDAADEVSATNNATLANVFGCLVYDDTLAGKNGISFNYFGGAQSVTGGTFTIVWNANGIFRITV